MTPEQAKKFPKYKGNPLFKDLSDYVKDPKNFDTIQKALIETLASPHSHAEVIDWAQCKRCWENVEKHRTLMHKFGFTSPAIYLAWKKTHEAVKKYMPLPKYNS